MENLNKPKTIIEYYVLCNKLKNLIRKGWLDWKVNKDRIESVAEHIYGVQMLAIAIYSEYEYNIDINKVILMLAIHELEEIVINDQTAWDMTKEVKNKLGHQAVEKILKNLNLKEEIKSLIYEFDERKTKEALFAYMCDKLECDIQSKIYEEENEECVDISFENQKNNNSYFDERVMNILKDNKTWSEMWLEFGRLNNNYDENFEEISKYVQKNKISNNY